jgi:hypothetical protein
MGEGEGEEKTSTGLPKLLPYTTLLKRLSKVTWNYLEVHDVLSAAVDKVIHVSSLCNRNPFLGKPIHKVIHVLSFLECFLN